MKKGKLYIIPTPIGNLGDITLRSIEILQKVAIIGAEDTRTSAKLMKHFKIETQLFSYHKFNERSRVEKILNHLNNGEDVAIISDAGTPGISDPAEIIIKEVLNNKFDVEALPGAAAFVPALVASGLDCKQFFFAGFLPEKETEKTELLESISKLKSTLIFYEAPHRIIKTIKYLHENLGDRNSVIARELTKIHETYYRCKFSEFLSNPDKITMKGEFILLVEGARAVELSDDVLLEMLKTEIDKGISKKEAVKKISSEAKEPRNRIYALSLKL
ncbi:MAG: 16S rRNA (cytidine(1402)-2'-O)-methyltransferase [Candidatus Cloacimonetes bacterium]|nr:16S rRNA (cytidine(1402)-2'-O)-methyltransferase [Candidatus Cloacimonadota bacterium]MCF7812855.1 16S rRNA (cytidine(1402)-2'-O)-methyltransferase [Candidatus Cloacimonadota bacterium]MCF7867067.1 16S rRNA (cytidine(1402)-2'-O)-methyltransferase [Candidatus Cloacimonadota bacterium]MCF7882613.1 16S rRNA (cytidine(1402)-2'-O)-methyltransferase [Candidatus Cloacimonadota bacterium]